MGLSRHGPSKRCVISGPDQMRQGTLELMQRPEVSPAVDDVAGEAVTAKVGELAREDATYRCEACRHNVRVVQGQMIEPCPNCGSENFLTGSPETLANQPNADVPAL